VRIVRKYVPFRDDAASFKPIDRFISRYNAYYPGGNMRSVYEYAREKGGLYLKIVRFFEVLASREKLKNIVIVTSDDVDDVDYHELEKMSAGFYIKTKRDGREIIFINEYILRKEPLELLKTFIHELTHAVVKMEERDKEEKLAQEMENRIFRVMFKAYILYAKSTCSSRKSKNLQVN